MMYMKKLSRPLFISLLGAAPVLPALVPALAPATLLAQPVQRAAPATGLDALDNEVVLNDLATYGPPSLLERAFEVYHVPEDQRQPP